MDKRKAQRYVLYLFAVILTLIASGIVMLQQLQSYADKQLIVFAGAAASPLYREIAKIFESKYGVKVLLNIGWYVFYYWYPDKADIVWIEPTKELFKPRWESCC